MILLNIFLKNIIKYWQQILFIILLLISLMIGFIIGSKVTSSNYENSISKITKEYQSKINNYIAEETKLENDLKFANEKASQVKEKIVVQYVDKIKVQKEKEYVYLNSTNQIPDKETVSKGLVYNHNTIVSNTKPDIKSVKDETKSDKSIKDVMNTVSENYGICEENKQQLESLQKWIRETKDAVEKKNDTNIK